jgi:hypothetical protein
MDPNPIALPERMPSEPDPPQRISPGGPKKTKTVKWSLSGFFSLKKLKGGFRGKRQVTVETFDD